MTTSRPEPLIIQGGMGVSVSSWVLARSVAKTGQMGVVSGTALDVVVPRRLQLGDPGGDHRAALNAFPNREMADRVLDRYFIEGGKATDVPFKSVPMGGQTHSRDHRELIVVATFVEVWLAKQEHDGLIGINFLEKIQTPTLPAVYGAMLAGVDYVLMGAGIPRAIPGVLDKFSEGEAIDLSLDVKDASRLEPVVNHFDPADFWGEPAPKLSRPKFLAIVSSGTLATMMARKASGHVDGFVIEGPTAGGHNAPPRGGTELDANGEPIYGKRDTPDLEVFRKLGRPFWMAGSYGRPERLREALDAGAAGIQVGTAFAFCNESGLNTGIKIKVLEKVRRGEAKVFTDPLASPTGFPFKVLNLADTISETAIYEERKRVCDLGYLRRGYKKEDGTVGWRCPSEPVDAYVRKGGDIEDTRGRKCICNALTANVGLEQARPSGQVEMPIVTCGDEVASLQRYLSDTESGTYSAASVVAKLLSALNAPVPVPHMRSTRQLEAERSV